MSSFLWLMVHVLFPITCLCQTNSLFLWPSIKFEGHNKNNWTSRKYWKIQATCLGKYISSNLGWRLNILMDVCDTCNCTSIFLVLMCNYEHHKRNEVQASTWTEWSKLTTPVSWPIFENWHFKFIFSILIYKHLQPCKNK